MSTQTATARVRVNAKEPFVARPKPSIPAHVIRDDAEAIAVARRLAAQFRERHQQTGQDTDRTFAAVIDQFAGEVEQGKRTRASFAEAEKRYREMLGQATHKDPGQPAEAATPAVVGQSMAKAAGNQEASPAQMRNWLFGEIDKAIASAIPPEYQATSEACCAARACLASSTTVGARTTEAVTTHSSVTASIAAGATPLTTGSARKASAEGGQPEDGPRQPLPGLPDPIGHQAEGNVHDREDGLIDDQQPG